MGVNMRNSEGYIDLTAYEALTNIERETKGYTNGKKRRLVYICSPLSGPVEQNQARARSYCRFAVDAGYIPLAPHIYFPQFMNDRIPTQRDLALDMSRALLSQCTQIWVFGKNISQGMGAEIAYAQRRRIPIRRFTEDCREVKSNAGFPFHG